MGAKPKGELWLTGALLVAFAALLIAPMTRWIVVPQLTMHFATHNGVGALLRDLGVRDMPAIPDSPLDAERLKQTADRRPDSFPLALGAALMTPLDGNDDTSWRRAGSSTASGLQTLTSRFPDEPALHAAILRYAAGGPVRLERTEERLLTEPGEGYRVTPFAPRPEDLALFERSAEAGERADPDNAYFPMMRAAGQFAGHRDDEALASVHRAARKPRYDDYVWADAAARDAIVLETYGSRGAVRRMAQNGALRLPHYSQIQAVAGMTAVKAMQAEQRGDAEAGFTMRKDMMRLGSLMRVQSGFMMGSLVGTAITTTQFRRPGGVEPPSSRIADDSAKERARLNRFCAYLQRIGHGESVAWVRTEAARGKQVREVLDKSIRKSFLADLRIVALTLWWAVGIILAANALWMLAFAGVANELIRFRRMNGRTPAVALCCTLAIACGLLALNRSFEIMVSFLVVLAHPDSVRAPELWQLVLARVGGACLSLAIPAWTLLVFGVVSAVHRVPISRGIVRGLKGAALPIACLLVVAYSGVVVETAREEARAERSLDRMIRHEGQYRADLVGMKWPGAVSP